MLVFGGSLGARSINEAAVDAFGGDAAGSAVPPRLRDPRPRRARRPPRHAAARALRPARLHLAFRPRARRGRPHRRARRRLDLRGRRPRPAGDPRALSARGRRPPDRQRALDGRRGRGGRGARRRADAERLRAEVGALLGDPARLAAMARPHAAWRGPTRRATSRARCWRPAAPVTGVAEALPWAGAASTSSASAGPACPAGRAWRPARRDRQRLGPRGVAGAGEAPRARHHVSSATTPPTSPRAPTSSSRPRSRPTTRSGSRTRLPRAELLRELTALKQVIAIAGAHGKTTTTSMVAHALLGAGAQPGYLIGGALRTTGENADWGAGDGSSSRPTSPTSRCWRSTPTSRSS